MSDRLAFVWDAEKQAMLPLGRFAKTAAATFTDGERYVMDVIEERSIATHNHFFASIHQAWLNLPEEISDNFRSEEHLRKYCLIKAGFYNSDAIKCETKAQAVKLAAFIRPLDAFSVVTVDGFVVTRYSAKSQSMKSMGKDEFNRSKDAVLDFLSGMIGTTKQTLSHAAAQ